MIYLQCAKIRMGSRSVRERPRLTSPHQLVKRYKEIVVDYHNQCPWKRHPLAQNGIRLPEVDKIEDLHHHPLKQTSYNACSVIVRANNGNALTVINFLLLKVSSTVFGLIALTYRNHPSHQNDRRTWQDQLKGGQIAHSAVLRQFSGTINCYYQYTTFKDMWLVLIPMGLRP